MHYERLIWNVKCISKSIVNKKLGLVSLKLKRLYFIKNRILLESSGVSPTFCRYGKIYIDDAGREEFIRIQERDTIF